MQYDSEQAKTILNPNGAHGVEARKLAGWDAWKPEDYKALKPG